ncbi:hypothetical protein [Nitrosomonas sp. wSCUT-2]
MPIITNAMVVTKKTVITLIFMIAVTAIAVAQQPASESNHQLTTQPQNPMLHPVTPPGVDKPPRTVHRIGTAIGAPRNSISIKSTDAGSSQRQAPQARCSNCGIVDFVNKLGQGPGLNAIASGVVAGTIAREVLQQSHSHPGINHPEIRDSNQHSHGGNIVYPGSLYQIGITMNDGRQAIINLPDAANFHQGDRVRWVDGGLVLDR